ncbi:MAG: hypothetical protein ABFD50_11510 [Smithella sp.]
MIFARYKGVGVGKNLTPGKMYLAFDEQDSGDTVSNDFIDVLDDEGNKVRFEAMVLDDPNNGVKLAVYDFEFFQEVYAVVTFPFGDFKKGQVVVVDEAEFFSGDKKDGDRWKRIVYNVKGYGYHSSNNLTILDFTNVFPGMTIMNESTGIWCKVKVVDEALWVVTECSPMRESPEAFRFAVDGDGDIHVEPYVRCLDDANGLIVGLTKGKFYRILREEQIDDTENHMVWLINDEDIENAYFASHFY